MLFRGCKPQYGGWGRGRGPEAKRIFLMSRHHSGSLHPLCQKEENEQKLRGSAVSLHQPGGLTSPGKLQPLRHACHFYEEQVVGCSCGGIASPLSSPPEKIRSSIVNRGKINIGENTLITAPQMQRVSTLGAETAQEIKEASSSLSYLLKKNSALKNMPLQSERCCQSGPMTSFQATVSPPARFPQNASSPNLVQRQPVLKDNLLKPQPHGLHGKRSLLSKTHHTFLFCGWLCFCPLGMKETHLLFIP